MRLVSKPLWIAKPWNLQKMILVPLCTCSYVRMRTCAHNDLWVYFLLLKDGWSASKGHFYLLMGFAYLPKEEHVRLWKVAYNLLVCSFSSSLDQRIISWPGYWSRVAIEVGFVKSQEILRAPSNPWPSKYLALLGCWSCWRASVEMVARGLPLTLYYPFSSVILRKAFVTLSLAAGKSPNSLKKQLNLLESWRLAKRFGIKIFAQVLRNKRASWLSPRGFCIGEGRSFRTLFAPKSSISGCNSS